MRITSVAPLRDLVPNSLAETLKVLQVWENRCSSVVSDIEAQIVAITSSAAKRKARERRRQEVVDNAVLNTDASGETNAGGGGLAGGGARTTRSGAVRGGSLGEENRKGKGIGNKRDLDEQQEDEETTQWAPHGGEEDGGVGVGLAKMEVDEGPGLAGKSGDGARTVKRAVGKKGL